MWFLSYVSQLSGASILHFYSNILLFLNSLRSHWRAVVMITVTSLSSLCRKWHHLPSSIWLRNSEYRIAVTFLALQQEIFHRCAKDMDFTHQVKSEQMLFAPRVLFPSTHVHTSEKAMAPHSSTLAWKIPWTEEPGRLQSMGSLRVGHDWVTSLSLFTCLHWRRKWQPTPLFLPGESQGQGSLVGCRLWGRTELDVTEAT